MTVNCSKCGTPIVSGHSYCEECGTLVDRRVAETPPPSSPSSSSSSRTSAKSTSGSDVVYPLRTWSPWRWLFTTNYGTLRISDDHLVFDLAPKWSIKLFEIINWIFAFGFNYLGFFRSSGVNQLKNIVSVGIAKPNWLIWRFHFLWVNGAGIFFLLPIPYADVAKAEQFVAELKEASRRAKYETTT